jgi:omega-amidase
MTKVGLIQTRSYENNKKGIENISKLLEKLGKVETEIVCLPEQWLPNNQIENYDQEFFEFKKIAKNYSMTIIPGAFYEKNENKVSINSPIIGPEGEIIGKQEKIHPYDYEKETVNAGTEAKIFNTSCKFGIMICYDTVFPGVADRLTKKGAQILFSPSRIVKEGIESWKMYVQVRSLENRIPIIAPNVEDVKFGGSSLIVELTKEEKIVNTRVTELKGECEETVNITFSNYETIRKQRIEDRNNFQ